MDATLRGCIGRLGRDVGDMWFKSPDGVKVDGFGVRRAVRVDIGVLRVGSGWKNVDL